ncbi:hypothetical protein ACOMHN_035386 [Nucella lapillus]
MSRRPFRSLTPKSAGSCRKWFDIIQDPLSPVIGASALTGCPSAGGGQRAAGSATDRQPALAQCRASQLPLHSAVIPGPSCRSAGENSPPPSASLSSLTAIVASGRLQGQG